MIRKFTAPRSFFRSFVIGLLLTTALVSGCGVLEVGVEYTPEPGVAVSSAGAQGPLPTIGAGSTGAGIEVESTPSPVSDADQGDQLIPSPTASGTPTPFAATASPSFSTPTPAQPPGPSPTPTPVAPLPGLVFSDKDGLWWVTAGPVFVSDRSGASLSPDGLYLLYQQDDDIWLQELATGEERNLTGGSGRVHCCARWWPARPDTIVFGSWPAGDDIGPTTGFLSAVKSDGTEYRVLDEEIQSNALSSPGPDGQTIAYDRGGTSWLYRLDAGLDPLDPAAFGLENVVRIGGPAWSPDGEQLAWIVAITDPEWRIAVAVFDLASRTAHLLHPYENAGRGGWFPPPAWSPDGRYLAFVAEDIFREARGVWAVAVDGSAAGGEEQFLGPGWNPVWSPDGRFLTYNSTEGTGASGQSVPWLVVPDSWYQIPFALPPGSSVADWVEPG